MTEPLPISEEFPDLFDGVPEQEQEAVVQVLASHRLDGMTLTREIVAEAIGYATGELSEAEYDQRVADRAATERG
ncbi:hypothetical protein OG225_41925 (plasmid) [Nocardia sp. NBC_01377]|uniref:antitoxin VbhA family protein n=1 Tax=Nocardia sp. NBC_01377 TaxID=2903595 RepID=UPI002F91A047